MKILYYQDSHGYGRNSANRLGNYYEDWLNKIREVHSIAKEYKCKKIIHGGDLYENPVVSNLMVDDFIDIVEETGIPEYIVWGNHDLIGHNIETSQGSSLAHCFRRSKLIKPLGVIEDKTCCIHGIDYSHDVEQYLKTEEFIGTTEDQWHIIIAHAFITPKPFFKEVAHVVCDDIKTNANLVLVAHYHNVWNKKVGNTEYLDIGCLGRLNINEHKIDPSVLILDTEKRSYEIIKLKSAKPGSEVFDLTKVKEMKEFDNNINNFISSLKSTKAQSLDIRGIITNICKENKVEKEVENLIIEKVGECE